MMLRLLSFLSGVAALILAGFVAIEVGRRVSATSLSEVDAAPLAGAATVLQPARASAVLGNMPLGSHKPFAVCVTNLGPREARLIGAPDLCTRMGCSRALDVPKTIPAGATAPIHFIFDAKSLGPLDLEIMLLFDVGAEQFTTLPLMISGVVEG